ncbi:MULTISPECIES: DUF5329 domain-containing protein [Marinomonas]|uniref:DUF5329 family protein n=1 Tax=Marinomonas TaxID=28253 RepID=UPI001BB421AA|nr:MULTISPECIES: DUF5329 domain-containing protein [Marinomonas]UTV99002.1 DUF5329 domain-containing protein [Marinomonas rhizomae]
MKILFFLIMTILTTSVFASTQDEINHLLEYVEKTNCQYERNGSMYNGKEAFDHIQRKYDYYQDKIKSAEDFIDYSASKSAISGKQYLIHCEGNKVVKSSDWLAAELKRFRAEYR